MRRTLPPRENGKGTASTRTILVSNKRQPPPSMAMGLEDSNYQSLKSVVSSDSRDEEDVSLNDNDGEASLQEEYVNPVARLRSRGNTSSSSSNSTSNNIHSSAVGRTASSTMAPPPPPPPATSHQMSDKSRSNNSIETQQSQQQNALLSLLKEMRALEQQMQQQSNQHALEKAALMDTISKQSTYINDLEVSNQQLQKHNDTLKKQLSSILMKLDRFATGCWKFSSASVKKMSEALHIQVREWNKLYNNQIIDNNNDGGIMISTSSEEEEAAMELITMEKMQAMHLEIGQLKKLNYELKEKMKRGGKKKKRSGTQHGSSGGSVFSGIDDSDEISHMSGITQMTATTTMTSGTKLMMDTMSGLLNENNEIDSRRQEDPPQEMRKNHREVKAATANTSLQQPSPKSKKPHKKTVQIASPRSILKQSRYDQRMNEQREVKVRMQQDQHQQQGHSPRRPPKSPKRHHNSKKTSSRSRSLHVNTASSKKSQGERMGFDSSDDFADDEFMVLNENEMWVRSWGEESEV